MTLAAYFYCDGANFNAIAGRVRPGDLGIDAMHINLHKTFSNAAWRRRSGRRPRGAKRGTCLAPFAPTAAGWFMADGKGFEARSKIATTCRSAPEPFGRMCAFHGQMGMYQSAPSTYMLSHGARWSYARSSEDAVFNGQLHPGVG